ncbi:MAG TPA: decaprenyl-phosphate phosphoribosyltransferase [Candidatus Hydrogenedens sp.]|nr:decaprenyl-phosphate phosphoribosyltransferase [Candidatus Hydrogenedens sp.]HOK09740.1 decaprenyl-phosphate phosphoribosyltransferase [Candidatus Hydrogenedens sp.]HOL19551.1 decaprenyl-phosphate phosphoribosyltransferase [Candidatus Hydrogenedens sp.]HPP58214.1 decaprenyl-phosphate phosphoribosyltransferase [Candidatus Hydrogenedens sp.]
MFLVSLIKTLRVYQWTKNFLVFAALIFAGELLNLSSLIYSFIAFLSFCFAASSAYILNDIIDIEKDRLHPEKSQRPIPSGEISIPTAVFLTISLAILSLALGELLGLRFIFILLVYVFLTVSYSLIWKKFFLVDVLVLALGFVTRAVAGAVAINVVFSNWLIVCTLFLALFLGLGKRRSELLLLKDDAENHRSVLVYYTIEYLDQLLLIVSGGALITFTIYTCSPEVIQRLHTDRLYLTLPFVIYGLFRYLYLVRYHGEGSDPSNVLISDKPIILCVLLWALTNVGIIYSSKILSFLNF